MLAHFLSFGLKLNGLKLLAQQADPAHKPYEDMPLLLKVNGGPIQ